jgi:CRISPR-associated endonuclease Cas1
VEIIASGANIHVSVRANCLTIKDKTGTRTIERVPAGVYDRLVVDGGVGIITLEAMSWMQAYGMSWAVVFRDRGVIGGSVDSEGDPEALRDQVNGDPAPVTRALLDAKLAGQARIAEDLGEVAAAKQIRSMADRIAVRDDATVLTGSEGNAASAYWRAWQKHVHVPFLADHMLKVPPRYLRFEGRKSLTKAGKKRNATDPANAMLNYAYTCLVSACTHACYSAGLHPGIGLSHNAPHLFEHDGGGHVRPSMALDIMEAMRPEADRVVLDLLDHGQGINPYLKWFDFLELDSGVVRVESADLKARIIAGVEALRPEAVTWAGRVKDMLAAQRT